MAEHSDNWLLYVICRLVYNYHDSIETSSSVHLEILPSALPRCRIMANSWYAALIRFYDDQPLIHKIHQNTYPCATDAKWAFDVVCCSPKPLGKIRPDGYHFVEHDTCDPESDAVLGCSFAESLVHQLDANLLTSGILFRWAVVRSKTDAHAEFIISSPYCTLSHLPGIATMPVLRAISSVGVVSILTSLATSAIFRLRMKLLKDPARQEAFAEVGSLSSVTPAASRHSC